MGSRSTNDLTRVVEAAADAANKEKRKENRRKKKGGLKTSTSTGSLSRNRISFGSNSTLVFEKEIADHDQDHKNAVWFSDKEMRDIRKDIRTSVKKGEISRGLEPQCPHNPGREQRMQYRASILKMHRENRRWGIQDDGDSLGMLSRALSADNLTLARQMASVDSAHAFQEHLETPQTCITRTSSKLALDNFRKTVNLNQNKSTSALGRLNAGNLNIGQNSGRSKANATFAPKMSMSGGGVAA